MKKLYNKLFQLAVLMLAIWGLKLLVDNPQLIKFPEFKPPTLNSSGVVQSNTQ